MIVDTNQLIDVSDAVPDFSDRRVLETPLWILASVVEDARLFVDVMKFKRLQLPTFSKLYILQPFDVDDELGNLIAKYYIPKNPQNRLVFDLSEVIREDVKVDTTDNAGLIPTRQLTEVINPLSNADSFSYTEDNAKDWRQGFVMASWERGRLLMPEMIQVCGENEVEFRGEILEV